MTDLIYHTILPGASLPHPSLPWFQPGFVAPGSSLERPWWPLLYSGYDKSQPLRLAE